ncbi:MAG: mechanosensitive ion channel [Phycisphaerales bacterium]
MTQPTTTPEGPPAPTTDAIEHLTERATVTFQKVWDQQLFMIDGTPVKVSTLVIALVVLIAGLIAAKMVSRAVGRRVLPRLKLEPGPASAIQSILYYLLVAVVVMLAMQMAAVPLTVFTIFGGALALGIGFGSQNIVNNFISGLILLIERPVAVGQLVEVDGCTGVVQKVGARSTVLSGYKGTDYIVPNSKLLESSVTNWNFTNHMVRSEVEVGVAYGTDTARVKELLLEATKGIDDIFPTPAPAVLFNSFGDSALVFEVNFWTTPDSVLERLETESELRFAIDRVFREAGIVIAFPQQDVHLDTLKPLEVRVVPSV